MTALPPVSVVDLFPGERAALLALLSGLSDQEWALPTACPGWSVHDLVLHLFGDDVGRVSHGRDGYDGYADAVAATGVDLSQQHQVGIINGSPLAMGLLSGMDPDVYLREVLQWKDEKQLRDLAPARRLWLWANDHGIPLVALALQFSMREPRIGATIVGAKTAAEVRQDIEAATMEISDEVWAEIHEMIGIPQ
jgi:hypothetical protein